MFNLLQNKEQKTKRNEEKDTSWQDTEYSWNTSADSESSEQTKNLNEQFTKKSKRLSLNLSLLRPKDEKNSLEEEKAEKLNKKSKKDKKETKSDSDSNEDASSLKDRPKKSDSKIIDLSKKISAKIHKTDHKVDETHSQDPELSPKVTPRESASQKNDDSKLPTPRLVVVTPRDGQVEKSDKSLNSSTSNLKAKDPSPRKLRTETDKLSSAENIKEKSPRRSHRDSIGSPREDLSPKSEPLLRHSSSRHTKRKSTQLSLPDINMLKEDLLADEDNIARALASLSSLEVEHLETKMSHDQKGGEDKGKSPENSKSPRQERIRKSEDRPRRRTIDEGSRSKENESPRKIEKDHERSPRKIVDEIEKSPRKKFEHSKSPRRDQDRYRKSERYKKRERGESHVRKHVNNQNEEVISFSEDSSTTSEYQTETTETSEEVESEEENNTKNKPSKSVLRKPESPEDPQDCAALCVLF